MSTTRVLVPSIHQQAIYNEVQNGTGHLCVQASAGAGKTTTILECLKLVPKFKRTLFLSFSNGIVDELKKRVPSGVLASTLHSLGYRMLQRAYKTLELQEDKYFKRALSSLEKEERNKDTFRDCYRVQDICTFARMTLTPFTLEDLMEMCEHFGLDWTVETITKSIQLLQPERLFRNIDFTDMIYLPVVGGDSIITQKYDYIFVDEAQDLNDCQKKFVEMLLSKSGRLICVGDNFQTIYGFTGVPIDSFEKLQQRPNTTTLRLPVSYRCGKKIVEKAKEVCDLIEPYVDNEDGEVRIGSLHEVQESDLVISRTTRPLVALYFHLIERDVKSTVVGKDIEKGLLQLAEKCKSYSFEGLKNNFVVQKNSLITELKGLGIKQVLTHPRYINLCEKIQVLELIVTKVERPELLRDKIVEIFSESKNAARLMTLHRSKGLENDRVFMIESYNGEKLLPSKYATRDWEKLQERNLAFVGYTRAKKSLIFISIDDL